MVRKVLLIAAGILFVGGIAVALACVCGPTPTPKEAFAHSSNVFAGTVESIRSVVEPPTETNSFANSTLVTFRVSQSWKGTNAVMVRVYTGVGGSNCGYPFELGSNYLVYANPLRRWGTNTSELATSLCTRTREYSKAGEDLRALGASQKPKTM